MFLYEIQEIKVVFSVLLSFTFILMRFKYQINPAMQLYSLVPQ